MGRKQKKTEEAPAPRIVAAVGTATDSRLPGLGERLDAAMVAAVEEALADGVSISDSEEILVRKAAARARVLAEIAIV